MISERDPCSMSSVLGEEKSRGYNPELMGNANMKSWTQDLDELCGGRANRMAMRRRFD